MKKKLDIFEKIKDQKKNKKQAVYVMLAIILCIVLLMIQIPKRSQLYLAPLGVWLLYALLLSTTEIQFS